MECGGRRSRTVVAHAVFVVRVAHAAKDVALAAFVGSLTADAAPLRRVSNRQSLTRLENAATCRKQTPEAKSNRHNRDTRHRRDGLAFVVGPNEGSARRDLLPATFWSAAALPPLLQRLGRGCAGPFRGAPAPVDDQVNSIAKGQEEAAGGGRTPDRGECWIGL